jgi:hypothetical protein
MIAGYTRSSSSETGIFKIAPISTGVEEHLFSCNVYLSLTKVTKLLKE